MARKSDIVLLRSGLDGLRAELHGKIAQLRGQLIAANAATAVTVVGLVLAAVKLG